MRLAAFLLGCLACAGHGRRTRVSSDPCSDSSCRVGLNSTVGSLKALVIMLLSFNAPPAAFNPFGHRERSPASSRQKSPGHREPVLSMSEELRQKSAGRREPVLSMSEELRSSSLMEVDEFDLEVFVKSEVPDCTSISVQNEQIMGFSGARVAELSLQTTSGERNLFLKVIAPHPSAADDPKQQRNLESYANEFAFLSDARFAQATSEYGARVPKTLKVDVLPGKRYIALQECMTEEYMLLPVHPGARTPEVLRWLAAFHSMFFGRVPVDLGLSEFGAHVHLDKRAAAAAELEALPANVASFCNAFSAEYPFFAQEELSQVGSRLQAVARALAHHLRPGKQNGDHTTLVHGDFKGANYFLKKEGAGVVGFDWQWTGPGIGATDLIFLFCTGVEDEVVDDYMSALRFYHGALDLAGKVYSFDEFLADFKVATLDYARWAFSYRLAGDTPAKFRERAAKVDMNLGFFRRHPPRVQWLLERVLEFLPEAESGQLYFREAGVKAE